MLGNNEILMGTQRNYFKDTFCEHVRLEDDEANRTRVISLIRILC